MDRLKKITLYLVCISIVLFLIKYLNILNIVKNIIILLIPLFIAMFYSWIFNPLIDRLSHKYKRNVICIILFLIIIICICLFVYLLIPVIYKEIKELYDMFPSIIKEITLVLKKVNATSCLDKISSFLLDNLPLFLISLLQKVIEYVGVLVVGLILGLYISFDYDKIILFLENIFKRKNNFWNLIMDISDGVRKSIKGTLTIALFVFIFDTLLFTILKLDAPILLGLVCGITDLIPYIGPYIGGAIAVCVGFTESRMLGILTLICCLFVQMIENYVLQPIIMSKSVKIPPSLVILGLLVFGKLLGIIGMIISTPCVVVLKILFFNYYAQWKRLAKG